MVFKSFVAAASCAAVVCGAVAGGAVAGEITGPVGPNGGLGHPLYTTVDNVHVLHGNSICAFSGLNNPLDGAEAGPGMVQSYGQIVAAGGKATSPSPGVACNGNTGFLAGGGGGA
jgi:hypothetical protein